MKEKSKEQKLIDICFQIGLLISNRNYNLYKKSDEEKAEWIRAQLAGCGFETQPIGCSYGVLIEK